MLALRQTNGDARGDGMAAREWKGPDFGRPDNAIGGLRLLILGESMWHSEKPVGAEADDMNEWLIGSVLSGRRYSFYNRLSRLVTNGGQTWLTQDESVAFWRSVVFYNYIPVVAATQPNERPPKHLWAGNTPDLFEAVVRRIKADAILVCGNELWGHLPEASPEVTSHDADGKVWKSKEFEVTDNWPAVAAHIPHPTGARGWSYEQCCPVVDFLFKRANELRVKNGAPPVVKPVFRGAP